MIGYYTREQMHYDLLVVEEGDNREKRVEDTLYYKLRTVFKFSHAKRVPFTEFIRLNEMARGEK